MVVCLKAWGKWPVSKLICARCVSEGSSISEHFLRTRFDISSGPGALHGFNLSNARCICADVILPVSSDVAS